MVTEFITGTEYLFNITEQIPLTDIPSGVNFRLNIEKIYIKNKYGNDEYGVTGRLELLTDTPNYQFILYYQNEENEWLSYNLLSINDIPIYVRFTAGEDEIIDYIPYFIRRLISVRFSIHLYNYSGESNRINKQAYLSDPSIIYGALNEQVDILNPSFLIELKQDTVFYNYCYIPFFKRYYFINRFTYVRENVYRLELRVDVLYTYQQKIKNQTGLVTRYEWSSMNNLVDNQLPLEDVKQYRVEVPTDGALVNTQFDVSDDDIENLVFSVHVKNISDIYTDPNNPSYELFSYNQNYVSFDSNLPNILPSRFSKLVVRYVMYRSYSYRLTDYLLKHSNLATYVYGLISYPFVIPEIWKRPTGPEYSANVIINDTVPQLPGGGGMFGRLISSANTSPYLIVADFTLSGAHSDDIEDFLNYEPYAQYEIFIPYYGWTKLSAQECVEKRLIVYYVVNYEDGSANVTVYNKSDHKVVWSSTCQLGVKIGISTSNQQELNAQRQANALNLALGLISSGVSVGVGIGTANPLAVVGGLMGGTKTVVDAINKNAMMFERAQATFSDPSSALYSWQKVHIKTGYSTPIEEVDANYRHLKGLPYNKIVQFTTLTGYAVIGEVHLTNFTTTTREEIIEIENQLKSGVVF